MSEAKGAVCVLFALQEEAGPFMRLNARRLPSPAARLYSGLMGVGSDRAAGSVAEIAPRIAPRCVILCGFAGGLAASLVPGSLVIAESVLDSRSGTVFRPDPYLLSMTDGICISGTRVERGLIATADRILVRAAEKRAFAAETSAVAVDMESAGAVQAAERCGIPWLVVRVVSDAVQDDLPLDFNALAEADGSVNRNRILLATFRNPHKIPALIQLGKRSSLAARNLADFLMEYVSRLPE